MTTGVIILVHGSRGERAAQELPQMWARLADGLKVLLAPGIPVIGAALQFNRPDLAEAVLSLARHGMRRIVVVPYFLFPGRHVTEDIPHLVADIGVAYPGIQLIVADNLGLDESFVQVVARRIADVVPGLTPAGEHSIVAPQHIETRSMEIIDAVLPPLGLGEDERAIVKRMVHASGDPQIARSVKFSHLAVLAGISAVGRGRPIFTDVRMTAAGISHAMCDRYGCPLSCALDEPFDGLADHTSDTRTAAAMRRLGTRLNDAVAVIGNAPTALYAVVDMVDRHEASPALVVGMPVGFVRAAESKEELMKRNVPFITIEGNRGGSPLAAAAVNALLKLAQARGAR